LSPEDFKELRNRNSGEKGHNVESDHQVLWSDSYRHKSVKKKTQRNFSRGAKSVPRVCLSDSW